MPSGPVYAFDSTLTEDRPTVVNDFVRHVRFQGDSVSSSSLAVCRTPAGATLGLALTCSQYKVSGCSVTSPNVVNVISWGMFASAVIAVDMLRRARMVSPGRPALSRSYGDVDDPGDPESLLRYNWMLVGW